MYGGEEFGEAVRAVLAVADEMGRAWRRVNARAYIGTSG